MKNNGNLGDTDGFSDVGEVDMFGLDEFGQPAGGDSMWGAVIGGGVGTGVAMIARKMTNNPTKSIHKFSELLGLAAGGIAGGVMMAFPSTRRMGWAAAATALVTNGLRQLENSLDKQAQQAAASPTGTAPTPTPAAFGRGFGIPTIEPGYVVPANLPAMANNGFGAVTIDPAFPVPGSIHGGGMGGVVIDPTAVIQPGQGFGRPVELVGPPTLVGAGDYGMSDNAGANQTKILGGPSLSAMGAHFGATLFGGNN
jgi:hypothetical protein